MASWYLVTYNDFYSISSESSMIYVDIWSLPFAILNMASLNFTYTGKHCEQLVPFHLCLGDCK